jgi:hypothetical protein
VLDLVFKAHLPKTDGRSEIIASGKDRLAFSRRAITSAERQAEAGKKNRVRPIYAHSGARQLCIESGVTGEPKGRLSVYDGSHAMHTLLMALAPGTANRF